MRLPDPSRQLAANLLLALGVSGALLVAWASARVNFDRGCVTRDTAYFDLCPSPPAGGDARLAGLRSRIANNPGDANAYVQLAASAPSDARPSALSAASRLAPHDPTVLTLQANAAISGSDWQRAVDPLVQLVEYRGNAQAALALAQLIGGGKGQMLAPLLQPGTRWFTRVLSEMPQAKAPFSSALPLVAQALKAGILDADSVRTYIRQLKASGAWADAFSLWLVLHGKPLPALYNSGFDEAFQADGFDWEVTPAGPASKAGAIVERRGVEQRGAVLDVRFTGRSMPTPLARQYLYLGEGRYRLRGDRMTRQLRTEHGLAWTVRCTASRAEAGRSEPLGDTAGAWLPFTFEFTIPAGCGLVASLQLETYAPLEATLGARGRAAFDSFSLEKLAP